MASFELTIQTDGAAFCEEEAGPVLWSASSESYELARILRHLADLIEYQVFAGMTEKGVPVLDVNGNTCGRWSW